MKKAIRNIVIGATCATVIFAMVIFRLPLILTFSNVAPSAIVFATKFISTSLVLSPIPL